MLYSKVVNKTVSATRLQNTVFNLQDQMKLDKASLHVKDLRIKSLEDLVLQFGVDPSNIQVSQALIKQKNEDIADLRKQLKLPQHEHPQAKEILQEQTKKAEMAKLIPKMTAQVKEMEEHMDILIKEKEVVKNADVQSTPIAIPIFSTVVSFHIGRAFIPKSATSNYSVSAIYRHFCHRIIYHTSTSNR